MQPLQRASAAGGQVSFKPTVYSLTYKACCTDRNKLIIPFRAAFSNSLKFNIQLSDATGTIVATAYRREAAGIFDITTDYLKENMQQVTYTTNVVHI